MPAPGIYVLIPVVIIGAVAAGLAFKQFVYEPHLAPKIEEWAEEFLAKRQARRQQQAAAADPVLVPVPLHGDEDSASRRKHRKPGSDHNGPDMRQSIELENLIVKEVHEWRSEVDRSQTHSRGLRQRGRAGRSGSGSLHSLEEPNLFIPQSPTQIVFKTSSPAPTLNSRQVQRVSTPPDGRTLSSSQGRLPTPDTTTISSTISSPDPLANRPLSPRSMPSLSQVYPLELDQEHGLELLSAPSSRPDSPFSNFSHPISTTEAAQSTASVVTHFHSFASAAGATSPPLVPLQRPPSRTLSDLDFFSDVGEPVVFDVMSPRSVLSDVSASDEYVFGDDVRSERSGASWVSAGSRHDN